MLRPVPLFLVACLTACQGKVASREDAKEAPAKTDAAQPEAAPAADAKAAPAKAEPSAPAPGAVAAGVGAHVRDPAWFNPGIWPGANVTKTGRSEADANGLFSSQILLDLPAGTTRDQCINGLMDKIKGDVADLAIDPKSEGAANGQIIARGSTEHIKVTLVCGEAKGAMKAYLGYQWTRLPEPPAP